jgi:hypothetical protein
MRILHRTAFAVSFHDNSPFMNTLRGKRYSAFTNRFAYPDCSGLSGPSQELRQRHYITFRECGIFHIWLQPNISHPTSVGYFTLNGFAVQYFIGIIFASQQ